MTPEQRKNLAVLTLYVASLPPDYQHFKMSSFAYDKSLPSSGGFSACRINQHGCGTSACMVGHGPLAGIDPIKDETWLEYVNRNFGIPLVGEKHKYLDSPLFDWLFDQFWPDSIPDAVKRAAWYLQTGGHPFVEEEELLDDSVDEYTIVPIFEAPEGWESFTPDMELITRIAKGEA